MYVNIYIHTHYGAQAAGKVREKTKGCVNTFRTELKSTFKRCFKVLYRKCIIAYGCKFTVKNINKKLPVRCGCQMHSVLVNEIKIVELKCKHKICFTCW